MNEAQEPAKTATAKAAVQPASVGRPPLPVVAVAGSVGKTTVASLLDHLVRMAGWQTVTWLDSGVTINGHPQVGELVPWTQGLQQVHQQVLDLGIQELAAATVRTVGLPVHSYYAGVITNLTMNDPAVEESPATALQSEANRTLAAAIHPAGHLILNADDLAVADLAQVSDGQIVYWALRRQSPPLARHLKRGGGGLYLDEGRLIWEVAGQRDSLGPIDMVPMTLKGQAMLQVQNLLAALATALVLAVPAQRLVAELPLLQTSPALVERQMTFDGGSHCRVVVARAAHRLALRALVRLMHRLAPGHGRVVGAAVWPAGLSPGEQRDAASILARLYSLVYLYGPGSEQGAELVIAARPAARPPTFCLPVASEVEAMRRLSKLVSSGDRVLLLTETMPTTVGLLDSYRSIA